MKKILIATGLFSPDIGGPATYSKILVEELPRQGIEVSVLPFGTVRNLPKLIRHIAYFFAVIRMGKSVDVIYAQDPVSVGLPAYLASRVLHKPFLVRIAGDYAWEQGVQRFGVKHTLDEFVIIKRVSLPVRILRMIQTKVAKGANRIVVPSKYLKGIVSAWGVPSNHISVIYSVFEGIAHIEDRDELRSKLKFSGTVLVSAGRLVPWKGFAELIELIPELQKSIPDIRFLIIGDGPDRSRLEKLIAKHSVGGTVSLLGRLPHAVLLNYVRVADLFVLNTTYEGFSHQLLEVMALGTPVITTAVGGNVELIEHERNGILVKPNDTKAFLEAITKVVSNKILRETLVEMGERRVKDFSRERMIQELNTLLQSL